MDYDDYLYNVSTLFLLYFFCLGFGMGSCILLGLIMLLIYILISFTPDLQSTHKVVLLYNYSGRCYGKFSAMVTCFTKVYRFNVTFPLCKVLIKELLLGLSSS